MEIISKKLSEVLFFQEGPGVRKTQFTKSGVKLLNGGNINNNDLDLSSTKTYISEEEAYGKYKHFLAQEGDLVIASSGVVVSKFDGKITFVQKEHLPLCMNTSTIRFRALSEEININYFYFFLKSISFKNQIQRLITGSAQLNFGPSHLHKVKITLPSPSNQYRIVKVLSQCETLIQKRKASIDLLDELMKSKFIEMFGTPETNPFGWDKKVFGDFTEYIGDIGSNGSNDTVSKNLVMSDTEDYAIMIRTTNLNANDFTKNLKYISKETYDFFSKSKIYGAEIIMNKIGSPGKFWIMPNLGRPVSLGLNQFVIRLKDLNTNYIKYFLSTNYGEVNIQSRTQGATTKSITKSAVRSLPVLYPPMELQIEFSELVDKVEAVKNKFNESLKELENLYGSISQRAFNGELDLSKVDISDMEDSKKKDIDEVKDITMEENTESLKDKAELIEIIDKKKEDDFYLSKNCQLYIDKSKTLRSRINMLIKRGELNNDFIEDLVELNNIGEQLHDEVMKYSPWQIDQHKSIERYIQLLPEKILKEYANINLFSRYNFDYSIMTLEEYYGVPVDIVTQYGSIGSQMIDLEFFFKKYFSNQTFNIEDIEEIYNRVVYNSGGWFEYKEMKDFIFTAIGGDDAFLEQTFETIEEIDKNTKEKKIIKKMMLKLIS